MPQGAFLELFSGTGRPAVTALVDTNENGRVTVYNQGGTGFSLNPR